jgi:hypothetical protein
VGLNEDTVDLFKIHDAGLVARSLNQGTHAKIAGAAQETVAGAYEESEGLWGEGIMAKAAAVELVEEEAFHDLWGQGSQESGVGDTGADFLVDGEAEGLEQRRLSDKHEVMRTREVLTEQAELAQAVTGHEMGVINDGNEQLSGTVETEGMSHQKAFAVMIASFKLNLKGLAEDTQGIVVGMQGAVDHGCDHAFGIMAKKGLFEDTFAGAGLAEHQAKTTLLGVNQEDVEDFLLMGQEGGGFGVEGMALEAEVGTKHKKMRRMKVEKEGAHSRGLRSLAMGSRGRASPMRSPL